MPDDESPARTAPVGDAPDWDALVAVLTLSPPRPSGECGSYTCEPGWAWRRTLTDFDAWLVRRGSGRGRLNDQPVDVRAGSLLVLRPGDHIVMDQDPTDRLRVLAVHFAFRDTQTGGVVDLDPRWLPRRIGSVHRMAPVVELMQRLVRLARDPHPLRRLEADGAMAALLAEIYREQARDDGEEIPSVDPRLQDVIDVVTANPARRFTLDQAAGLAGMPASSFSRLFSRTMGVTFRQFAVQARLQRAKTLLEESPMSVSQVARALGYSDAFLFSRQFREHYAQPPSESRRSQQAFDRS